MRKIKTIAAISFLFFGLIAFAQSNADNSKDKESSPQIEPKTTKKDAKAQCRADGKTGRELIECIRDRSKGD